MLLAVAALSAVALSAEAHLTYVVFPGLIWAALRFGPRGGTLAVAEAAALTIVITAAEAGAFVEPSVTESALSTQLYVAVAAISTLTLAATVSEQRRVAQQLAVARDRIIVATDAERRRIERDLHDGAQQHLVALGIRVGLTAEALPANAPVATRMVGELGSLVDDALADLRSLAAGIYPPVLAQQGLGPALRDLAAQVPVPATVAIEGERRWRADVEAAAYFCCSEAVQNVAKHAPTARSVKIRVRHHRGGLDFEVADDGPGFTAAGMVAGDGMTNMRERVEAVRGTLTVRSFPGGGTRVSGHVPAR